MNTYYQAVVGNSCHHKHRTEDTAERCLRNAMKGCGLGWPPKGVNRDGCGIVEVSDDGCGMVEVSDDGFCIVGPGDAEW
jgi:hypothetical protein